MLEGTEDYKEAKKRQRTLEVIKQRTSNITIHQKLYMKSPILKKIPGFPDPDQDYSYLIGPSNMRSISTKASASKPKNTWSNFRSKTVDVGDDTLL